LRQISRGTSAAGSASRSGHTVGPRRQGRGHARASPTQVKNAGARYFKLKLNGDPEHDAARLTRIGNELATLPYDHSVTLDANEAIWPTLAGLKARSSIVSDRDSALNADCNKAAVHRAADAARDHAAKSPLGGLGPPRFYHRRGRRFPTMHFRAARGARLSRHLLQILQGKSTSRSSMRPAARRMERAGGERFLRVGRGPDLSGPDSASSRTSRLGALIGRHPCRAPTATIMSMAFADTPRRGGGKPFLRPIPTSYARDGNCIRLSIHDGDLLTGSLATPGFATGVHPDWSALSPLEQPKSKNSKGAGDMTTPNASA